MLPCLGICKGDKELKATGWIFIITAVLVMTEVAQVVSGVANWREYFTFFVAFFRPRVGEGVDQVLSSSVLKHNRVRAQSWKKTEAWAVRLRRGLLKK